MSYHIIVVVSVVIIVGNVLLLGIVKVSFLALLVLDGKSLKLLGVWLAIGCAYVLTPKMEDHKIVSGWFYRAVFEVLDYVIVVFIT